MTNEKTQLWKQAVEIYKEISELPVSDAIEHVDSIHNLSYELKQAVITLVNAGNQASQYIDKNFSPQHLNKSPREINYQVGDDLGDYRLLEELGKGGMSYVFKAKRRDVEPQKLVAIKIFSPKSYSPQLLEHFISEQKILSELNHANIVDMLHGGKAEDGATYLVMELIDEALPINKYGHNLSTKEKINLILQCAQALAYSHANLIIHRDLKPDNILIDKTGQLKIVDFGIAKLINNTRATDKTTIMALTPSYAAPEQVNSEKISTKTDIFSLAVVAVELLYGKKFLPKDRLIKSCEKDEQAIAVTLKSLNIDKDLKNILHQGLAQNPNDRYPSMQSFADDLNNYLQDLPVTATAQSVFYRLGKFAKRRKALFISLLSLLSTLILSLGVTLWQNHQIKIESAKAQSVKQFMLDAFEVTDPNVNEGLNISAQDILKIATDKIQQNSNIDDKIKFDLYQSIGIAYGQLGFLDKAINMILQSLAIEKNDSKSLSFLAHFLQLSSQENELIKLMSKVNISNIKNSSDRIRFHLIKTKMLIGEGKFKEAFAETKLIKDKQTSDEEYIQKQRVIASIYFQQSNFKLAINTLNEALNKTTLTKNNTYTLGLKKDLVLYSIKKGDYDTALSINKDLIKQMRFILNNRHPDLGDTLIQLSDIYLSKGDMVKALKSAQESYKIFLQLYGKNNVKVAKALTSLGILSYRKNELEDAEQQLSDAVVIYEKNYPLNHIETLEAKTNLAAFYNAITKTKKAERLLQDIYKIQLQTLGEKHRTTILTQQHLARAMSTLGKHTQAIKLAKLAIKNTHDMFEENNPVRYGSDYVLAKIYQQAGKYDKALELYLTQEKNNNLKTNNPKHAILQFDIASCYAQLKRQKKANEFFNKSIKSYSEIFSPLHPVTLKIQLKYAQFLKEYGQITEMKEIIDTVSTIIENNNIDDKAIDDIIQNLKQEK